jgi:hypothetical protein
MINLQFRWKMLSLSSSFLPARLSFILSFRHYIVSFVKGERACEICRKRIKEREETNNALIAVGDLSFYYSKRPSGSFLEAKVVGSFSLV